MVEHLPLVHEAITERGGGSWGLLLTWTGVQDSHHPMLPSLPPSSIPPFLSNSPLPASPPPPFSVTQTRQLCTCVSPNAAFLSPPSWLFLFSFSHFYHKGPSYWTGKCRTFFKRQGRERNGVSQNEILFNSWRERGEEEVTLILSPHHVASHPSE